MISQLQFKQERVLWSPDLQTYLRESVFHSGLTFV